MLVSDHKVELQAAIDFLKHDIGQLRTGKASVSLVEDLLIEAYGAKQPLKATATITTPDPKSIFIEPWDKGLLTNIEKAIINSPLGMNPTNDGQRVVLTLPQLTSERRAELVKVLHQKLEAARIAVRKVREEARDKINKAENNKEIGEDEKFKLQESLEKLVKEFNVKIKEIGDNKEKDITTV